MKKGLKKTIIILNIIIIQESSGSFSKKKPIATITNIPIVFPVIILGIFLFIIV